MVQPSLSFSYFYGNEALVEFGNEPHYSDKVSHTLLADISKWNAYFASNFDEDKGFTSPQAQVWIDEEYRRLCKRLRKEGIRFQTSMWWTERPKSSPFKAKLRSFVYVRNLKRIRRNLVTGNFQNLIFECGNAQITTKELMEKSVAHLKEFEVTSRKQSGNRRNL